MIQRLLIWMLAVLGILFAVLTINTLRQGSHQVAVAPPQLPRIDMDAAAARLAGTLQFKTIASAEHPEQNRSEFAQLHDYLQSAYPHLNVRLKREEVGNNALLYTWQGTDAHALPVLWMAHQDVVPVTPDTEQTWSEPPFGGTIADGFIWGRGAWDDKGNLCAQLEAIEQLVASGFQPRRTIYLAFGADEEVGGARGAKVIAELLRKRGVRLDYVLDEGLLVTEGMLKGLDRPAALIGIAEKGYLTLTLTLRDTPGHSSMPPSHTVIGTMSAALARLEQHQFPAKLNGVAENSLVTIAPEMGWVNRVLLSNLWLFKPLVENQLATKSNTNAMLRTTSALTVVHAGNKDNVLPGTIEATVNFRLLPGDSQASVIEHVRQIVANEAIKITPGEHNAEASPISSTTSVAYQALSRSVRQVFPNAVIAPGLMLAATDSRHFASLSDNVFKFTPVRATADDLSRFHGSNERVSMKNYEEMIHFYRQLVLNSAQSPASILEK